MVLDGIWIYFIPYSFVIVDVLPVCFSYQTFYGLIFYSRASPTMRDAIQGMLSMSCGSRLLSGSSLLRSPTAVTTPVTSWLGSKRSSLDNSTEDINAKLMTCYKDNDFGEFLVLTVVNIYIYIYIYNVWLLNI